MVGGYTGLLNGDFDGDGKTDLWSLSALQVPNVDPAISKGNGEFVFATQSGMVVDTPYYDIRLVADLNGDGKADVLLHQRATGVAAIGISTGKSFLYTPAYFGPGYDMLRLADFNGDGYCRSAAV